MPKLKQVTPLQIMAMDVFFDSIVQCCNRLSGTAYLGPFRAGVIAIREEVSSRLPGFLLAEFASRFLESFHSEKLDELHYKIALEMIMDIDIIGLRLKGRILQHLDLHEGGRFRKLAELDLNSIKIPDGTPLYRFLQNCRLNNLTTIVYPKLCTDIDLEIIGKNCPKLEIVNVDSSNYVTDEGLRNLSPCSNLRVVHFYHCRQISHLGLNHMLCVHEKLEDFYYGHNADVHELSRSDSDIDESSGMDMSVEVPSMNRLVIASDCENYRRALNLQAIVNKFPNLNYLKIHCEGNSNLSVLKYLNKLTGLEINFVNGWFRNRPFALQQLWMSIVDIGSSIGANITTLTLCARHQDFVCRQEQLNLIFHCYPNLERLDFDHLDGILVVPEFQKLKVLTPHVLFISPNNFENYNLEFGKMLNLEILTLPYLGLNLQKITSMMLDDDKFPKLSVLRTQLTPRLNADDLIEIERIAKNSNFDFRVERLTTSFGFGVHSLSDDSDTDDYEPLDLCNTVDDGDSDFI